MDTPEITLPQHEAASATRAATLGQKIDSLKESDMGTPVNVFHTPTADGGGAAAMIPAAMMAGMGGGGHAGAIGGGLGAGLVGGLLGGLLFGGRGFGGFGTDGVVGGRAAAALDGTDGMAIIGAIGSVKDLVGTSTASILAAVNATDNHLSGAIANGFAAQSTNTLQQTIMLVQEANRNAVAAAQAAAMINQNVLEQGCETRAAVTAEAVTTRLLVQQLDTQNLNRLLTVADLDRRDEAHRGRSREVEVNVTQTVNQNNLMQQQQQQQQQIVLGLSQICGLLGNIQIAQARQTSNVIGNTGAVTGTQTANPVNVM
jgi:hypothetical protein